MSVPKKFNPIPFPYHKELEITIDFITNLGKGVGKSEGWVIMVPFVMPGEYVRVRIFKNYSNYSEADLVEILKPASGRVVPKCKHFSKCGGCQYQHISYDEQINIKTMQVADILKKNAEIDFEVKTAIKSPLQYAYRSKITPHYNRPDKNGEQPIGFLANGRKYDIIDVNHCPIATNKINENFNEIRERAYADGGRKRRKRGGTLLLRDTIEGVTTDPKKIVSQKVGSILFQFRAGDFFQNNPSIINELVNYVKVSASGREINNLVDAYCGVGLFALSCSSLFKKVVGVEISESAIDFAKTNAKIHKISNVLFQKGNAESIFSNLSFDGHDSSVVVDPPRKGCDLGFLDQLIEFKPKKVIYVSCDPATQARDIKYLVNDCYTIREIQPFDLFPHTRHIESVAILERKF